MPKVGKKEQYYYWCSMREGKEAVLEAFHKTQRTQPLKKKKKKKDLFVEREAMQFVPEYGGDWDQAQQLKSMHQEHQLYGCSFRM